MKTKLENKQFFDIISQIDKIFDDFEFFKEQNRYLEVLLLTRYHEREKEKSEIILYDVGQRVDTLREFKLLLWKLYKAKHTRLFLSNLPPEKRKEVCHKIEKIIGEINHFLRRVFEKEWITLVGMTEQLSLKAKEELSDFIKNLKFTIEKQNA